MNPVVRYWITVLSFVVGTGCVMYLFLSFLFPDVFLVVTTREVRLVVTAVAVIAIGLFTWAAVFLTGPEPTTE